jgi:hypothetical protein
MKISRCVALIFMGVVILATHGSLTATQASADANATGGLCPGVSQRRGPTSPVSQIQSIQFELMRRASFNSFDGARVARDLLRHRQLWCGALIDRVGTNALIKLRDLGTGSWNVDTLYILSSGAKDGLLLSLARSWRADEIRWIGGSRASTLLGTSRHYRILEAWWD